MIICIIAMSLNAQEIKYELYKCSSTKYRTLNSDESTWSEWRPGSADFIIRIAGDKFEFNNEAKTVFYINKLLTKETGVDKDNDKYSLKEWSGYDKDGLVCHLMSIDYIDLANRNFILEYQDVEIFFQCKIINTPVNSEVRPSPIKL